MKVKQLSLADYNQIENIPVINQDLSASGFTPTASTYYRHTGTTGTYTQGVIYYYDGTEYKALDGSKGTVLNKYSYGTTSLNKTSIEKIARILQNAKIIAYPVFTMSGFSFDVTPLISSVVVDTTSRFNISYNAYINGKYHFISGQISTSRSSQSVYYMTINQSDNSITFSELTAKSLSFVYYNDTEII